jgi:hypothetical protein
MHDMKLSRIVTRDDCFHGFPTKGKTAEKELFKDLVEASGKTEIGPVFFEGPRREVSSLQQDIIRIPSTGTQNSPCLRGHHVVRLDTASGGQVHQSHTFCNTMK